MLGVAERGDGARGQSSEPEPGLALARLARAQQAGKLLALEAGGVLGQGRGRQPHVTAALSALGLDPRRRYCRPGPVRYGVEVASPDSSLLLSGASGAGVSAREVKLAALRCGAALAAPVLAAKTA